MNRKPIKNSKAGFSILELLVTMAISSIIMVTLISLIGQTTDGYTQNQRAVSQLSQARAFIQLIESELSTRLPSTPLIHQIQFSNAPQQSDQIAFVRTLASEMQSASTPGDLATSTYYVAFGQQTNQSEKPKLFRKILNPTETQNLIDSDAFTVFPSVNPHTDEAIIDNILCFRASPKFLDPSTGELQVWNSSAPQPPRFIEISIRFIDEYSARRFTTQEEWKRLANSPRNSELPLIQTFTHTIQIAK